MIPAIHSNTRTKTAKRRFKKKNGGSSVEVDRVSPSSAYLSILSDPKARRMLEKGIFLKAKELGVTRKQYYSRLSALKALGLMKKGFVRKNDRLMYAYSRTTLGETMNNMVLVIEELARNAWRFKSLDSVNLAIDSDKYLAHPKGLTPSERSELEATLFSAPALKHILSMINEASRLSQNEHKQEQGGEREN